MVVLHADQLRVLLLRPPRRQVVGVQVVCDHLGRRHRACQVEVEVGAERGVRLLGVEVAEVRREERPARATQNVLFIAAPDGHHRPRRRHRQRQRVGRVAAGATDRERRAGTTESSQRRWIGRSCARNASAMPHSRSRASSSSNAIGSSERLPLVITSGPPKSASSRWCSGVYGSITPSHGLPGATASATGPPGRRRTSTIGRSRDRSSASSRRSASASSSRRGRHHGERLVVAVLARPQQRRPPPRRRRRRPGGSRRAPSRPARRRSRSRRDGVLERACVERAARRPGTAIGSAWNRRSRRVVVLAHGSRRTSRSRPSSCSAGRRGRRGRW